MEQFYSATVWLTAHCSLWLRNFEKEMISIRFKEFIDPRSVSKFMWHWFIAVRSTAYSEEKMPKKQMVKNGNKINLAMNALSNEIEWKSSTAWTALENITLNRQTETADWTQPVYVVYFPTLSFPCEPVPLSTHGHQSCSYTGHLNTFSQFNRFQRISLTKKIKSTFP